MATTLREAAESVMELASKLFEDDGRVGPHWMISTPDNMIIVKTEFTGNTSKDMALDVIKQKFGSIATRIIFVSECWMRSIEGPNDGIPPSQHPDRKEMIHLIAEDRDGEQLVLSRIIERDKDGVPTLLAIEAPNYKCVDGRFASFFDRATDTKH